MAQGSAMEDRQVDRFEGKDPGDEQDDQTVDNLEVNRKHRGGSAQQRTGLHLHQHTARRMD